METPRIIARRAVASGVLLAALARGASAQVVSGILRDAESRRAAPALWIDVRPQGKRHLVGGVRTDSTGRFVISTPDFGLYQVEISMPDGTRHIVDSVPAVEMPEGPRDVLVPLATAEAQRMYFDFQVERQVRVRRSVRPTYPSAAAGRQASGEVLVQVAIDSTGVPVPETLRILRSPDESLSWAAREAVLQWRFEPARLRGRSVRQMVQLPFLFVRPDS